MIDHDLMHMRSALALAQAAADAGETPVGAVLVDPATGEVVAEGRNAPIALHDPTAHAEMQALRAGAVASGNYRLTGLTLYVTLEPCAMCAGAISHARIGRLVYGASDPKGGAVAHGARVFDHPTCHWRPEVTGGVLADESASLLTGFFRARRKRADAPGLRAGPWPSSASGGGGWTMADGDRPARAEIQAVLDRQMAAWKAGDAEAFGEDVADEVVFTNIVGLFSVGRARFDAQHAHIFATFYKDSEMRQTLEHVAFVRPDVAVVDTLTEVRGGGPFPPDFPGHGGPVRTRLEQVMVREDGRWRVAAFHNVAILPGLAGGPPGA